VNVHGVKSPQSVIERCRKAAVTVLATAGGARDFASVAVSGPRLLVVGNESRGLRPEVAQAADETVGIPMAESAESLNVSVAAGILMHHYARPIERLPV
jgi:tRNA G18 (ribose-2'-O)-methylase SpoU